jgi:tyrosinase
MASIEELQARTEDLLKRRTPVAASLRTETAAPPTTLRTGFSPFLPTHAKRAFELTDRFVALADATDGDAGLKAVLEAAENEMATEDPDLVKHALMVFITHHPKGARLPIPALEERAPEQVAAPDAATALDAAPALGPSEADLNWFRQDPMANAHHEHWHQVYPWQGIPDGKGGATVKDRQGELFFYMHQQMLARYDAERLAVGLPRVKPLAHYHEAIPEGYDHGTPDVYSPRPPGLRMADIERDGISYPVHEHELRRDRVLAAIDLERFETRTGAVPVNVDLLGATEESSIASVSKRDYHSFYGNHHGMGHVLLGFITDPTGTSKIGAIMTLGAAVNDPVFFRWHKHVDDLSFRWQESQEPHNFSDSPKVLVRKGSVRRDPETKAVTEMQSPDIILCFKESIPGADEANFDGQAFGQQAFGGENWNKDLFAGGITTDELQTMMLQRTQDLAGQMVTINYLDHKEFFYFLRVENLLDEEQEVTVRIFLAPKEVVDDRRMWIEMDKFRQSLEPFVRKVIFRQAQLSSVIQKPATKPPRPVTKPANEDDGYCTCGWPYNLLIPRGTRERMHFRLMVMITDWQKDRVPENGACGSMSFCGAKDRYPDRRGMGYPFDRPFPGTETRDFPIREAMAAPYYMNIAARDFTIRWVEPPADAGAGRGPG